MFKKKTPLLKKRIITNVSSIKLEKTPTGKIAVEVVTKDGRTIRSLVREVAPMQAGKGSMVCVIDHTEKGGVLRCAKSLIDVIKAPKEVKTLLLKSRKWTVE